MYIKIKRQLLLPQDNYTSSIMNKMTLHLVATPKRDNNFTGYKKKLKIYLMINDE
jgi:hypothetical protein